MSDLIPPRRPDETRGWDIAKGIALTAALHVGGFLVILAISAIADSAGVQDSGFVMLMPLLFIGAVQVLYMLPAWMIARRKGRHGIALGLVIGAALTFLANSACFGTLFLGGLSLH